MTRAVDPALGFLKNHIYIVALLGLTTFYIVQRIVNSSRTRRREAGEEDRTSEGVFWLNISWFSMKNAIVGYLILREERTLLDLLLFFAAISLEFLLSDRGLHRDHKASYDRLGRWVLIGAVFLGWGIGYLHAFWLPEGRIADPRSSACKGVSARSILPARGSGIWGSANGATMIPAVRVCRAAC